MKKNLLYVLLCSLVLLAAACSALSPASLRETQNDAVLLPPESEFSAASEYLSNEENPFIQENTDEEMVNFVASALHRLPASIQISVPPEEGGDPLLRDITYDGVIFTVVEHEGERVSKWYYTELKAMQLSPVETEYYLTGWDTFEGVPLSTLPPEELFLMQGQIPADYFAGIPAPEPEGSEPETFAASGEYSRDTAIANGDYVNIHGEIYNAEVMDTFLASAAALEPASIRTVQYTIEGDPILTDVVFDGSVFTVTEDSRLDKFGSGDVHINSYQRLELVYVPDTDITEYRLTEPGGGRQTRPQDYMVLKYDLGDTTP